MANKVVIVTDTTACIPSNRVRELGIKTVPIEFIFSGRVYRDGIDITPSQFYALLEETSVLPTTTGSVPGPYIEIYSEVLKEAKDILCITEPSKFSGMHNAAKFAARKVLEENPSAKIHVLDCSTAAAGLGLTAIAAAEAAKEGKTLPEVIQIAKDIMQRIRIFAYIDNLYYLVKGGRVPKIAHLANSFLQIKPVFTVYGGDAHNISLPMTESGASKELIRRITKAVKSGSTIKAAVMHAASPQRAVKLGKVLKENYKCRDIFITEFTPVMGVHTGPGVIGAAFYECKD